MVLPGGTATNRVIDRTCWPGQPGSQAPAAVAYAAAWARPPQTVVTDPAGVPAVATVTGTMAAWVAASSGSTTGRVNLNGSAMGRSFRGIDVVVVVGGGCVVVVGGGGGAPAGRRCRGRGRGGRGGCRLGQGRRRGRLSEHGHDHQDLAAPDHPVGRQDHAGPGVGRVARLDADHPAGPDLGHDVVDRARPAGGSPSGGRPPRRRSGWPCRRRRPAARRRPTRRSAGSNPLAST